MVSLTLLRTSTRWHLQPCALRESPLCSSPQLGTGIGEATTQLWPQRKEIYQPNKIPTPAENQLIPVQAQAAQAGTNQQMVVKQAQTQEVLPKADQQQADQRRVALPLEVQQVGAPPNLQAAQVA